MSENQPENGANGYREVKAIPLKLNNGPRWLIPAEVVSEAIESLYRLSPELGAALLMPALAGEKPDPRLKVTTSLARQSGAQSS